MERIIYLFKSSKGNIPVRHNSLFINNRSGSRAITHLYHIGTDENGNPNWMNDRLLFPVPNKFDDFGYKLTTLKTIKI